MAARTKASSGKPAKRTPAKRPAAQKKKPASQRVFDELSTPKDTFAVQLLIEQLADLAEINEKLRRLTSGDLAEWVSLKLGPQVVQVSVDDPIRRRKEVSTEMRQLLAEIHRQRADLPIDPDDDDDPATKY
ncbi:MAG: hypothetical protein ACPGVG_18085 [Mycobacterium sp.]